MSDQEPTNLKETHPVFAAPGSASPYYGVHAKKKNRKRTYVVDNFQSLPEHLRLKLTRSGITTSEAEDHLEVALNVLHFKTRMKLLTQEQYDDPTRKLRPRHNTGDSLVSPDIVSVLPLEQEQDLLIHPDRFEKVYTLGAYLGKGGFGKVYRGLSRIDKTPVAVKKLQHVTEKQMRKNFQEIRYLRYLDSEYFTKVHGAFKNNDGVLLVTDLVDGGTLAQIVSQVKLREKHIAYICYHMLQAIKVLHDSQLAHRDLKSPNIMISSDANLKIIDFGLCSDMSQGEVTHMVGSPFWMPPEMILRNPHGLKVDIWSFGICAIEMANGVPPHRKSSLRALFTAGVYGYPQPFEDPSKWSDKFADFLSHCLQIDASNRWDADQLLQHPFLDQRAEAEEVSQLLQHINTTPRGTAPVGRDSRQRRRIKSPQAKLE